MAVLELRIPASLKFDADDGDRAQLERIVRAYAFKKRTEEALRMQMFSILGVYLL